MIAGGTRDFRVPLPDDPQVSDEIPQNVACAWKGHDMSLLEWLRKTNAKGQIVQWLKQKFAAAIKTGEYHDSLEKYAESTRCLEKKCSSRHALTAKRPTSRPMVSVACSICTHPELPRC